MTKHRERRPRGPLEPVNKKAVDGWQGGFSESNEEFSYPNPKLDSLPLLGNLENIDKIQRQQKVLWPEFSWETIPGDKKSRVFQMFAPDVSRVGYTNEGRVFSLICPQQGAFIHEVGTFNVEVTVTGQRGWVNETDRTLALDMTVVGTVWFGPVAHQNPLLKSFIHFMQKHAPHYKFPLTKADALLVYTHVPGNPEEPMFPVRAGQSERFEPPEFATHWNDGAWTNAQLEVEIGGIVKTGDVVVDRFNQLVMNLFNAAKGNLLKKGNILTWNVWFEAPSYVDITEWEAHAEKWRLSIDHDHGNPDGEGHDPRFADGTYFNVKKFFAEEVAHAIEEITHFTFLNRPSSVCNVQ